MSDLLYKEKLEWLFNQFPVFQKIGNKAFKPTLDNTISLIQYCYIPYNDLKYIHVAGTNGKGTTCSIIASALKEYGMKVGLFTSPHIKDFRERIRVNGEKIPRTFVTDYITRFQKTKLDFQPSFFEMTWVMALSYFYNQKCDIVIVETGLGGRLDATNVITPELSIITNIGLDHIAILGNSRTEIAQEKAGIIKNNTPIIIGEYDDEVEEVFLSTAIRKKSPIYFVDNSKTQDVFDKNKKVAFKALELFLKDDSKLDFIRTKAISNLSLNTGLYGRCQVYSENPLIIIDAAHNEIGVKQFLEYIKRNYSHKKITALYGASNDKAVNEIVKLFPNEWSYFITEFKSERSMRIENYRNLQGLDNLNIEYHKDAKSIFDNIKSHLSPDELLIVFGSFYLLEEII